ncbi:cob(I)yrinic acid a,c-diamide adenosyltransferase [Candidatus Peregrinibacteria bacterium]|nr:cob(I)yrinic acid a,c-diamide adenosyltransferase [Candidatus Peregrinibacteria bacterium]
MILVVTGNGKGKTTSAIGTALRGLGWGKTVSVVFFDKGGSHYGEQTIFDFLQGKMNVFRFGLERFNEAKQTFRFENLPGDFEEAEKALAKVRTLLTQNHFLVVADELINAMNLGLVKETEVKKLVEDCPVETHLMLTGRNAPAWLIEKADMVSEVKEVKHHYKKTRKAIQGIDY